MKTPRKPAAPKTPARPPRRTAQDAGLTGSQAQGWRIRVTTTTEEGKRKERTATLPPQTPRWQAVKVRDELREQIAQPAPPHNPTPILFGKYILSWLEAKRATLGADSFIATCTALSRLPAWLTSKHIPEVNRADLQELLKHLASPHLRRQTGPTRPHTQAPKVLSLHSQRHTWVNTLSCLRDARADLQLTTPDPADRLKGPPKPDKPAGRALEPQEAWALVMAAQAHSIELGAHVRLALTTGLRRDEMRLLRHEDLHLDQDTPHLAVPKGKTRAARRLVPIPRETALALEAHIARCPASPYVFPGQRPEEPRCRAWFARLLAVVCMGSGLAKLSPHDLRRTYITALHAAGVDVVSRQLLAGHTTAEVSAIYTRPSAAAFANHLRPAWSLLDGGAGPYEPPADKNVGA